MRFNLHDAIRQLQRTPEVIRVLVTDLPEELQKANDGGETWSAYDVVGHLVHCEKADWMVRARVILDYGETRPFEPFDRLAQFTESKGKSIEHLLEEFQDIRAANMRVLSDMKLTEGDLDRKGVHPAFGSVSLRQLMATWIAHDYSHIVQISRTLAKQYREEVGPWAEYLSVMG